MLYQFHSALPVSFSPRIRKQIQVIEDQRFSMCPYTVDGHEIRETDRCMVFFKNDEADELLCL